MEIKSEKRNNGTLVQVTGRLDAITAPDFEKKCILIIESGEMRLVIDFTELEYISSAGLRSIFTSAKKLNAQNGTILFCGLSGMVLEVFEVAGLATMFTMLPTVEEAFDPQ